MIKKELLRFTLSAIIAYLTGFTLNLAIATSQLSGGNGTHFCGVIDGQLNKQHSDQFPNRRYARTFAANLNAGEPYTVQLIYFLPSDRQPRPNIDIELDRRIKETQQYYADEMEYHGFGRKTFRFETDATGKAVIHHVRGRFNDAYYQNPSVGSWIVWNEIDAQFDTSRNIYLLVLDISSEYLDGAGDDTGGVVGRGSGDSLSGKVLVPTSYIGAALHELGHAFGLMHDTRFDAKVSSGGYGDPMTESFCSAEWLDVHRYFNTSQNAFNEDTSVQMLTSSLAAPPDSIRLRFEVADPDGLHQAQLFKPFGDDSSVIDCKQLNGKRMTIEFVTTKLIGSNDIVLRVIDAHGNFTWHSFPIDITPLLPPPEAISIPDPNLATVVRETLGMAPSDAITQLAMLNLGNFNAVGRQIINLTGIEIATNIYQLRLEDNQIRDITLLAGLTKLNRLYISGNPIGDISPLVGLTNLQDLRLGAAQISDITPLARLTKLVFLHLWSNRISDLSPVAGLTNLRQLYLENNSISDLSSLVANTGLGDRDRVYVQGNPLSYLSIHTHIPTLQSRGVTVEFDNRTPRPPLKVSGDDQWGIPDAALEHPFIVEVRDQKGEVFAGVPVTFAITAGGGTFSATSTTTDENGRAQSTLTLGSDAGTNTISVSAAGIEGLVTFQAISNIPFIEYILSIPAGISLIHVPLKVTAVDGVPKTITSIGDLYDVLGSADTVNFLITYDSKTQGWLSYFGATDKGTSADVVLTDDKGVIVGLRTPVSIQLRGAPLGTDGSSAITLNQGLNLVGLPLRDSRIMRVSDLFALEGIGGNVPVIILTDDGAFKSVGRARDPGDIPIIGGQSFIMTAQRAATVAISGEGWYNVSEVAAGPPLMAQMGIEVGDTTPVLALRGSITSPVDGWGKMPHLRSGSGFRVIVKNLSTGRAVAAVTKDENLSRTDRGESMGGGYQGTIVDVETGRAARIGDILEVSVRSPDPLIGVQPLRYTVTAEDVKRALIQLPELSAYKIPAETQLLPNYPNPFNPETWIPYRLAEDAFVTLTIYDGAGQVVRTLDVGHQIAAVYENRSKAIYWDGRNGLGEQVASGVYFYHLSAGDYSATRKMVILK